MNVLILLMGGNNIPNYVTAKYLLNSSRKDIGELSVPTKLFLVFSRETEKFRNSLVRCLRVGNGDVVNVSLGSDERKHSEIKRLLAEKLAGETPITSVHLNYTGGTKTMVLAAYEAVEDYCKGCSARCFYSYLDPENFKLRMYGNDQFPFVDDLRYFVLPTISDIFKLHCLDMSDYKPKGEATHEYNRFASTENFFAKITSANFKKSLDEFKKNIDEEGAEQLKDQYANSFCDFLREQKFLDDNESLSLDECRKFYALVAGEWLEQAVFNALRFIRDEDKGLGLSEIFWNVEGVTRPEPGRSRKFEIDVMALRGYQMFVFSCTSSSRTNRCKQKAFEVNYRAVQMGGGHAKSVLVCLGDDNCLKDVKDDMAQFEAAQNFSIIGRETLSDEKKLKDEIRSILTGI